MNFFFFLFFFFKITLIKPRRTEAFLTTKVRERKGYTYTIPKDKLKLFPDVADQVRSERGEETELACHIRRVAS